MSTEASLGAALDGIVIMETGDEHGEFASLLLGSLGAEIIKLEGRSGSNSRRFGPFTTGDSDPEHSLFFSRYNLGKRSVSLELAHPAALPAYQAIAKKADVIIDSGEADAVDARLKLYRAIQATNPRLIVCTITPFGLDGPYRNLKMTDLIHLAMGGVMATCGYDALPDGVYDTPPIAPGMWQSYHIACEHAAIAVLAALNLREFSDEGTFIDLSIHEAVSTCTEVAIPTYIYNGAVVRRQTGRHAAESRSRPWLRKTRDGRYVKAFLFWGGHERRVITEMLNEAGVEHDLDSDAYRELAKKSPSDAQSHFNKMIDRLAASMDAEELYHRAQSKGLLWASVRYPEENIADPHFQARGTFQAFSHPELGRDLCYPVSVATDGKNRVTAFERGAPRLGEHNTEVLSRAGFSDAEIAAFKAARVI